jgi:hypothetical protein
VSGHPTMRKLALGFGFAAGLVYVAADMIESPGERIEVAANEILDGFQTEDLSAIGALISKQSPELKDTASKGLSLVSIEDDFHIKAVELKSKNGDELVVRIRANGNVKERTHSMTQRTAEYWETTWVQESEKWVLSKATRLNPMNGQPRGTFDSN